MNVDMLSETSPFAALVAFENQHLVVNLSFDNLFRRVFTLSNITSISACNNSKGNHCFPTLKRGECSKVSCF